MPLSFSEIDNIASSGRTPQIDGERVTTILPDNYQSARSVTILDGPNAGNLTVNPNNSLSLVMTGSDHVGPISFRVEVVNANGTISRETIDLRVTPPSQEAGWGTGENHYMLETDARGDLVIETGENHRDVFISAAQDALSIADIAAREGISRSSIDGEWLIDNPEYGANPNMALAVDAGTALWRELHRDDAPNSHWLHLERGYTYDTLETRSLTPRSMEGESELHPVVITAYGSGAQPIITDDQTLSGEFFTNIVIHDLEFRARLEIFGSNGDSGNIILDGLTATEDGRVVAQNLDSLTVSDVTFHDIHQDSPSNGSTWQQGNDRISSLYVTQTEGVLIEESVFTEVGWEDGFTAAGGRANAPQAPSQFSHNVYINATSSDVTFRDNFSAQAASYGGQLRAGGFIEDNLFLDNNAGFITRGGDYFGYGPIGNFSLLSGNVVTSGAHKDLGNWPGALTRGIVNGAEDTVLLDNVVAHLADPDNPSELRGKTVANPALLHEKDPFYDNTVVYNWDSQYNYDRNRVGEQNQNLEGLNLSRLDDATATNLARQVLNNPNATMNQLVDWMANNDISTDQLLNFFRQPFGTAPDSRGGATDVRFVPSELTDGVRWDNRENWSTGDVAGTFAGDRVDLGGNWVVYGGTQTIRSLDFGADGTLTATNGRLNITGQTTAGPGGATLSLDAAGQVWMGGGYNSAAALDVIQDGGRFANTGVITGNVNLSIDDGQALLSAEGGDFILGRGETLTVRGADADVGFDGTSNREGIIRFDSGSDVIIASDRSGLGSIGEFRSGAYGEAPRVDSNIHLGGTDLTVDLRAASQPNGTYVLMSADEISGSLGSFSVQGLGNRSATLTVNYNTDEVTLGISSGSGVRTRTVGEDDGTPPTPTPPPPQAPAPAPPPAPAPEQPRDNANWTVAELNAATDNLFVYTRPDNLPDRLIRQYDSQITGNDGNNTLNGTGAREEIFAGAGDDVIAGNGNNDLIYGGQGNDRISGNGGSDIIHAAQNDDYVNGGWGNDFIGGGWGDDQLFGGIGDDNIFGSQGRDQITGGAGRDILTGGDDSDVFIFARNGSDWDDVITDFQLREDVLVLGNSSTGFLTRADVDVSAYNGSAVISHQNGYILLDGVSVNTVVNNAGAIFGDASDLVTNNTPTPTPTPAPTPAPTPTPAPAPTPPPSAVAWTVAELNAATQASFVFEGMGDLYGPYLRSYDTRITGTRENETETGTSQNEEFRMGNGADLVRAQGGNDLVRGGYGDDRIFGEAGSDIIHAGQNDDLVIGGAGNDVIGGGSGNDQITGGSGADMLTGDRGDDIFVFARNGSDWDDVITDFQIGEDVLLLGNAQSGYLRINDVSVDNFRGNAVLSQNDGYILLEGISVSELQNNAASIFGDSGDLIFA